MAGSTVPTVLAAVGQMMLAAAPADWAVVDGPVWDLPRVDFGCFGFTGNPDEAGVSAAIVPGEASMQSMRESLNVFCTLTAHMGTDDPATLRATVFAAFDQLAASFASDPSMGSTGSADLSLLGQITEHHLIQNVGETGVAATVAFTIRIDAWKV